MQLLLMLSLMIDLCSLVDHPIEKEVPILLIGIVPTGETESAGVWIL